VDTNFTRITYRVETSGGQGKVLSFFTGALPNLFTAQDAVELEKKLSPDSVRENLTVMRQKLAGPEGMVLKDIVAADPIGESSLMLGKVLPLQAGFGGAQVVDGRVTSSDGRHVLMILEPVFSSADSRTNNALVKEILGVADKVEKQFPGVHVAFTGG